MVHSDRRETTAVLEGIYSIPIGLEHVRCNVGEQNKQHLIDRYVGPTVTLTKDTARRVFGCTKRIDWTDHDLNNSDPNLPNERLCRVCIVQMQPRKHVLVNAPPDLSGTRSLVLLKRRTDRSDRSGSVNRSSRS